MVEKKSKYDTDPLDPEFVRRTEEMMNAATRDISRATTEPERGAEPPDAPTRLMDETLSRSYPSIFVPPAYQAPAQPAPPPQPPAYSPLSAPPRAAAAPPTQFNHPSRNVAGLNIPEKFATVLPYAPFYIGLVAALVELLIVPRREVRVRLHAAQGLALQLAFIAVTFIFRFIGIFADAGFGRFLVSLTFTAFLIYSMVRVWRGKEHHLSPLDEVTRWLNERIEPRQKQG